MGMGAGGAAGLAHDESRLWAHPGIERCIAWMLILTGFGELAFWGAFFTVGLAPEQPPACYLSHERAFVLPDVVIALGMIAAGSLRLARRLFGRLLSTACAGSLVFLGMLDVTFNLQNDVYRLSSTDLVLNGLLNGYCIAFGAALIWLEARQWGLAVTAAPGKA